MPSDHERYEQTSRRQFLKVMGGAAGALAAAPVAYAHHHAKPSPQSLPYLDQTMYLHNMEVIAHALPGQRRGSGMQMMAIGERRFLFQSREVIEVTNPRNPRVINQDIDVRGGQLAYNAALGKWILMTTAEASHDFYRKPFGKYDDPEAIEAFKNNKEFRGVRFYDVTDPTNVVKLSEYSTGPTGFGAHGDGCWYDGGRYAYLAAAPDDTFVNQMSCIHPLSHCLVIVDVSDPTSVKEVSRWWVPGQRSGEIEQLKRWRVVAGRADDLPNRAMNFEDTVAAFKNLKGFPALDRMPYTNFHGPMHVPARAEDGGTVLGYGAWSAFGMLIHDVSDVTKPRLVGTFDPTPVYGMDGIPIHTIWLGMLDRGFVVTISEALNPDCNESFLPNWVVDVRDPAHPVAIASLGRPKAPPDAPFTDFCFKRGRFSAHNPPPLQAPGRTSQTFLPVSYFNAGVRCYDLSEPTRPEEVAYFVPPHAGDIADSDSINRPVDNVFVEWDRRIIYVGSTAGLYVMSCAALGEAILDPLPVTEWSLPHLNVGAP